MFVLSPKGFFLFAEVVSRLGCDNLDEITREDMALEVVIFMQAI